MQSSEYLQHFAAFLHKTQPNYKRASGGLSEQLHKLLWLGAALGCPGRSCSVSTLWPGELQPPALPGLLTAGGQ